MRQVLSILLIFLSLIAFSQSKQDFLACFEIITEHDDFKPAYENREVTGQDLVIVNNIRRNINRNEFQKIFHSITSDDFYDFSRKVLVIQGDDKQVRNLGYNPRNTLNVGFVGKEEMLIFALSTVVENRNLNYNWNYKFVKEAGEWNLTANNTKRSRTR
ncbi:hypothetical protein OAU00_01925 [Saprospiraceae bacterium]|nr:hypothetical protein [bacterium]MDB4505803.1 hypothetical protein [Saprospiraceae bacterium]MDC3219825.1 hypothetical protein [Saprospiraceae bacterium]